MSIANDIRGMIVGAAIGAGVVAHVLVGWPGESIVSRESEGPLVRAGQSGVAHASASEAPASPYPAPAAGAQSTGPDLEDLFRAIGHVESGNNDETPPGDGGQSHGRYQIKLDYWQDAWGLDDVRPVTNAMRRQHIADVTDPAMARETMLRYWRRYCPEALDAGDWRTLARVHNGGPRGATKAATEAYAADVLAAVD